MMTAQRTERLTRDNALLLLVDHQVGLYTGVRDIDVLQLKHNIVGLTRAMLALKVPVIVTTTTEKMWGPLIPELTDVLPGVQRIERTTVNAWDEKRVVDAVKATGRRNLNCDGHFHGRLSRFPGHGRTFRWVPELCGHRCVRRLQPDSSRHGNRAHAAIWGHSSRLFQCRY